MNRFFSLYVLSTLLALSLLLAGCGVASGGNPPPPPPPPTPPTISFSSSFPTATISGPSVQASLSVSGSQPVSVTCSADIGSASPSGTTAANYTPPTNPPSSFTAKVTCEAKNSAGTASASATVNLQYPAPALSASGNRTFFLAREALIGGVMLDVSGVFENITTFNSSISNIFAVRLVSPTQVELTFNFDTPHWNPGFFEIWATNPLPGGGDSNRVQFAFLGNHNPWTAGSTHFFFLHQGNDAGLGQSTEPDPSIDVYDLQGNKVASRVFTDGGLIQDIAYDAQTDTLVFTHQFGFGFIPNPLNPRLLGSFVSGSVFHQAQGAAAIAGYGFAVEPSEGTLAWVDLRVVQDPLALAPVERTSVGSAGSKPWVIAAVTLAGQPCTTPPCPLVPNVAIPVVVGFNVEDLRLWVFDLQTKQVVRSITLVGLTPASQLTLRNGGWDLAVSNTGKAALLHRADQKAVVVDFVASPAIELASISLTTAMRDAADDSLGVLWLGNTDRTFDQVMMSGSFTVTRHSRTSTLIPVGFGNLANGLAVCERGQCQIIPKQ